MWQYQNTDELYHHGVLGMRWGVRKVRSSSSSNKKRKHRMSNRAYKKYKSSSKDSKRVQNIKRKKVHQMSNEELRIVNNRDQLERNYKQNNKSKIALGMAAAGTAIVVLNKVGGLDDSLNKLDKLAKKGKSVTQYLKYQTWLFTHR